MEMSSSAQTANRPQVQPQDTINQAQSPHGRSPSFIINLRQHYNLRAGLDHHTSSLENHFFHSSSPSSSTSTEMCFEDLCSCIVPVPQTSNSLSRRLRRLSISNNIRPNFRARSHSEDSIVIEEIDSEEESDNEVLVGEFEDAPTQQTRSEFTEFDEQQREIIDSINDLSSGEIRFSKLESGVKRSHSEFEISSSESLGTRRRSFGKGAVGRRTRLRFEFRAAHGGMDTDSD